MEPPKEKRETVKPEPKKEPIVKEVSKDNDSKEGDNEDSINLTIGEEDEKLLHDHHDSSIIECEKKGEYVSFS